MSTSNNTHILSDGFVWKIWTGIRFCEFYRWNQHTANVLFSWAVFSWSGLFDTTYMCNFTLCGVPIFVDKPIPWISRSTKTTNIGTNEIKDVFSNVCLHDKDDLDGVHRYVIKLHDEHAGHTDVDTAPGPPQRRGQWRYKPRDALVHLVPNLQRVKRLW